MLKKHYTIGCCGIDCALCPRYYTKSDSKCPGCGGPEFSEKHPSCAILNCCFKKHKLEVCSLCEDFPCDKYKDKDKIEKDSFVTHKKIHQNFDFIKKNGLEAFISVQKIRAELLTLMLEKYNDNKSKSFFCKAVALLSLESINHISEYLENNKDINTKQLKIILNELANSDEVDLK